MIGANEIASKNAARTLIIAGIVALIAYQFIEQQEPSKQVLTY